MLRDDALDHHAADHAAELKLVERRARDAQIAYHPVRPLEPEPINIFDRVPDGSMVPGCWNIGSDPHWTVLDYT
jgi:hypothetical protein